MISYNSKSWFTFFFRFHKSDTIRQLFPLIISISAYAFIVAYFELEYWKPGNENKLKNLSLMHTLLGFVISTLLVFRTNTAYDRWWEGRKLWGALVNNSRNLAVKLSGILPKNEPKSRLFFRSIIPQYAVSLKNHLRLESTRLALDEAEHPEFNQIAYEKHVPNQIHLVIFKKINDLYLQGKISPDQYRNLNPEIQAFADICGACERIKNTPIPFSYSSFIKKFIFIYCITLPLGYVSTLHYLVVPLVVFVFYVLASLEIIAEEIENPFGTDDNDLPLDTICKGIHKSVIQSFDHTEMLTQAEQIEETQKKGFSYEK